MTMIYLKSLFHKHSLRVPLKNFKTQVREEQNSIETLFQLTIMYGTKQIFKELQ